MTAAEYRKWAKDNLESATLYAKWAKDAEQTARWWFDQRGQVNSGDIWGALEEGVIRYDLCREKFLQFRRSVKHWRRLAVTAMTQYAEYTKKAQAKAREEKLKKK